MRLSAYLSDATRRLGEAGVEQPRRDARLLLCQALRIGTEGLIGNPQRLLDAAERARADSLLARRAAREPVARIIGEREFWSLPFALEAATLDPRPDSETLIESVLAELDETGWALRLLDLGCGTGCLLLALLSELPEAWGLGIDIAETCPATARANARSLGLGHRCGFLRGNWGEALGPGWDVILCNPPYLTSAEIAGLEPEVARYEPRRALDGGPDGLNAYRLILPQVVRLLGASGLAALEIGPGQVDPVIRLAEENHLQVSRKAKDLAGRERCLILRKDSGPMKKTVGKSAADH